jgi:hypothetical protein
MHVESACGIFLIQRCRFPTRQTVRSGPYFAENNPIFTKRRAMVDMRTILVLEPDLAIGNLIAEVLGDDGYQVWLVRYADEIACAIQASIRSIIYTRYAVARVLATCCLHQSGTLSSLVFDFCARRAQKSNTYTWKYPVAAGNKPPTA